MKNSYLILLLSVVFLFSTCRKKEDEDANLISNKSVTTGNTVAAGICGVILNEANDPISGAVVSAYGRAATTNTYGVFYFDKVNVDEKRCIVKVSSPGFYDRIHAYIPTAGGVNYLNIVLMSKPAVQTFLSSSGGTLATPGGASVQFSPNTIVQTNGFPYSGTVNVTVKQLATDAPNFSSMIPGGDLVGRNTANGEVMLVSYGMLLVDLSGSNGEPLALRSGTSAKLTMPIAANQQSSADAIIPLWYFDEEASLWKEQGQAVKTGNSYVGNVFHFTPWNCDKPRITATVKGRVVDKMGNPIPNIMVSIDQIGVLTNQSGEYTSLVTADQYLIFYVNPERNPIGFESQIESVSSLAKDQVFIVPDLICTAPYIPPPSRIRGDLTGCNDEVVNGFVSFSENGKLLCYQYTSNGKFDVTVPSNTDLDFSIMSAGGTRSRYIRSADTSGVLNAGTFKLCGTAVPVEGTMGISIYNLDTLIKLDPITSVARDTANGLMVIHLQSTFGAKTSINICVDPVPGNYVLEPTGKANGYAAELSMKYYAYTYNSYNIGGTLNVTIESVDDYGGLVNGTFSGLLSPGISNYPQPVVIKSAKFSVLRK